ncbi:phage tail tape measure protein [Paenibacillus sp. 481]|uniref:phage tail tape measure protein n=1 Tax=Paenibacillus sp. 481 TaxID=2835869 RepID=UPI001E2B59AA|nr:phage tail tape measure protein [Paenibacillus sp. 481]UHA74460.1 phage tail tape measure protein [Paenibacillus sp. 481]
MSKIYKIAFELAAKFQSNYSNTMQTAVSDLEMIEDGVKKLELRFRSFRGPTNVFASLKRETRELVPDLRSVEHSLRSMRSIRMPSNHLGNGIQNYIEQVENGIDKLELKFRRFRGPANVFAGLKRELRDLVPDLRSVEHSLRSIRSIRMPSNQFGSDIRTYVEQIRDLEQQMRRIQGMHGPSPGSGGAGGRGGAGGAAGGAFVGAALMSAPALAVGAGAAYAVGSSTKKAMDFEAQIDSVQVLGGLANNEMGKVQALALKMGATTKYSALEAAQGMEELIKAGMSTKQVMGDGLEASLNLAAAGGVELAEAAEIMSTAMNAYSKDGMKAADAANILAGVANASATSVEEMRYSLSAVSAVASGVGMTFRDTSIAMGLFANKGLKGSDAGTSLKTMLATLQPKSKEQIKLFHQLGLMTSKGANQFFTAKGKLKDLSQISGLLQKSMKHLTDQQRAQALQTMFGSDAVRAGNILFEAGAEGVKKFNKEMSETTALDVAKGKMDNAKGAVEQFSGAMETLQIAALLPTMPLIKKVATAAADFVGSMTTWLESDQAKSWGAAVRVAFQGVGNAMVFVKDLFMSGLDSAGMDGTFQKVGAIKESMIALWTDIKPHVMSVIESIGSIIAQVIPVVASIGATFYEVGLEITDALMPVVTYLMDKIWPVISKIFDFLATKVFPKLSSMMDAFLPRIVEIANSIGDAFNAIFEFVKPILDELFNAFNECFPIIENVVMTAIDGVEGVIDGLLIAFKGITDFITNVFTGNWEGAWQGVKDIFIGIFKGLGEFLVAPINIAIDLINGAIESMNSISFDLPGGGKFGVQIPLLEKVKGYAEGGIVSRPELAWIGEGGDKEVIVPINNSQRSMDLWKTAGSMLGVTPRGGGGTTTVGDFIFSPTIIVHGNADEQVVKRAVAATQPDFERQFNAFKQQVGRVSMK